MLLILADFNDIKIIDINHDVNNMTKNALNQSEKDIT